MTLKNILLSGLLAASAMAAPSADVKAVSSPEKRYTSGWCGLHIEEDASQIKPNRDLLIRMYDHKQKQFYWHEKWNVHDVQNKITLDVAELEHPMYLSLIDSPKGAGPNHYLSGWEVRYGGEKWKTTDEPRCHAGPEAGPGSDDTANSRSTRKYDCGFTCELPK